MVAYLLNTSGWCSTLRLRLTFTKLHLTTFASMISNAHAKKMRLKILCPIKKLLSSLLQSLTSNRKQLRLSIKHMSSLQSILNSHNSVLSSLVSHKNKSMLEFLSKKHLSKCTYSLAIKACLAPSLSSCLQVTSMVIKLKEKLRLRTFSSRATLNAGSTSGKSSLSISLIQMRLYQTSTNLLRLRNANHSLRVWKKCSNYVACSQRVGSTQAQMIRRISRELLSVYSNQDLSLIKAWFIFEIESDLNNLK